MDSPGQALSLGWLSWHSEFSEILNSSDFSKFGEKPSGMNTRVHQFSEGKIKRIWCKSKGIEGVDGSRGAARLAISWGLVLEGEMTDFDPNMWICGQGEGEAAGLGGTSSPCPCNPAQNLNLLPQCPAVLPRALLAVLSPFPIPRLPTPINSVSVNWGVFRGTQGVPPAVTRAALVAAPAGWEGKEGNEGNEVGLRGLGGKSCLFPAVRGLHLKTSLIHLLKIPSRADLNSAGKQNFLLQAPVNLGRSGRRVTKWVWQSSEGSSARLGCSC